MNAHRALSTPCALATVERSSAPALDRLALELAALSEQLPDGGVRRRVEAATDELIRSLLTAR